MDFELSDEQRLLQDTVRRFVDDRILPNAVENDINHHLDLDAIEGMAELGILGIVIPEEYGGAGLDFVCEALACEEIERGEAAFRTLISVHVGLNSLALLKYASEEQKQRWLVPQARGEKLACFGLTEPAAGSDVAAMKSTARREGDAYVLNGSKNWISYANVADHALVFAKTDPSAKHKGISAFVIERGMNGFTTADTEHKLGIWAGSTGELFFENVEVPAENMIGEEGQGFEIAMYGLDQGRFTVAAGACGVIRACLESSVEYARERETFGQPIGKYQFVQDMIAEMVLGYETSKLLVMQAAWMKDQGMRNTRETSLAKWHATEIGVPCRASRDPGARRVRLLGGVRDRALLPQRARADHLRRHDADPQDDAGRACARLPAASTAADGDVSPALLVGTGARPRAARSRSDRRLGGDRRAQDRWPAPRADDRQLSVESFDAIGEAAQTGAHAGFRPAYSIVLDLRDYEAVISENSNARHLRPRVLRNVRQALRHDVVDRRLDLRAQPLLRRPLDFDGHRRPDCKGFEGIREATISENGRMDAASELPELAQRFCELRLDRLQLRGSLGRPAFIKRLARDAKRERETDEPLLRTVVEVTLDPVARRIRRLNDARSRRAQLLLLTPQLSDVDAGDENLSSTFCVEHMPLRPCDECDTAFATAERALVFDVILGTELSPDVEAFPRRDEDFPERLPSRAVVIDAAIEAARARH